MLRQLYCKKSKKKKGKKKGWSHNKAKHVDIILASGLVVCLIFNKGNIKVQKLRKH